MTMSTRACILAAGALGAGAADALDYRIEADGVRVGDAQIDRIEVVGGAEPVMRVRGVSLPGPIDAGDAVLACDAAACRRGAVTWRAPEAAPLSMALRRAPDGLRLVGGATSLSLRWIDAGWSVTADAVPLAWAARMLSPERRPAAISGRLEGSLELGERGPRGRLAVSEGAFDSDDGRHAASGLELELEWRPGEDADGTWFVFEWRDGEMLLGPAYLPAPTATVSARARLLAAGDDWRIAAADVRAGDGLAVDGSAVLGFGGNGARVKALSIARLQADLDWLWRSGLQSLAGAAGWSGLAPTGRLDGALAMRHGSVRAVRAELRSLAIEDTASRLRLAGGDVEIEWNAASGALKALLAWRALGVYALPLGPARASFSTRADGRIALDDSWRIPLLDGALVIDQLAARDWRNPERELRLDANLEPVDLAALTRAMGWPEMGGRISGRFRGLRVAAGVAAFAGGLSLEVLDGRARVAGLSIERPFGTLPALSADVRFDDVDLEPLTRTFEFGRMTGLASGYVRGLRLLDWRPVRFDAWIETRVDSPERVISQQAVDSLAQVGGGSAASGLLLRWFDRFPYRKAGLGCELAGDVCTMRGLREADNGGYVILEGREIPRLDIIGHRRRVDFPRLLAQLSAAGAAQ